MDKSMPHSKSGELPMVEFVDDQVPPSIRYPPPPPLPPTTNVDYSKLFHPWDPLWWKHFFTIKTWKQHWNWKIGVCMAL
jgi:hypothetical protein